MRSLPVAALATLTLTNTAPLRAQDTTPPALATEVHMIFPATTAFYAALFALLYVGLSAWVVVGRLSADVLHGDGGDEGLGKRMRAQGNFGEYVPFALLLVAFLEASGGGSTLVHALLIVLLVGRILHPFGMFAAKNSPMQFACRGGGILATFAIFAVAGIALLLRLA